MAPASQPCNRNQPQTSLNQHKDRVGIGNDGGIQRLPSLHCPSFNRQIIRIFTSKDLHYIEIKECVTK